MTTFSELSVKGPYATFVIRDVDLAIVNAVRRAIMAEVPTAAFCFTPETPANTVDIVTNTSVLHNEFLGHRISLVPVHLNSDEVARVADGISDYVFHLKLTKEDVEPRDVTSAHFTGTLNGEPISQEELARLFPADPVSGDHILIVRLRPAIPSDDPVDGRIQEAEQVEAVCRLHMGRGKEHARWVPTSLCTYGFLIDDGKAQAVLEEEVVKARANHATQEEIDRLTHDFQCTGKQRCYLQNAFGEPSAFRFKLRSECGLTPVQLFDQALSILARRLHTLSQNVAAAGPPSATASAKVTMEPVGAVDNMFQFIVAEEDHTLGNLTQSLLYNRFIRDPRLAKHPQKISMVYIGYHQPHPLENRIVLRVKVDAPKAADVDVDAGNPRVAEKDMSSFLSQCIDAIASDVDRVRDAWTAFTAISES